MKTTTSKKLFKDYLSFMNFDTTYYENYQKKK